MKGVTPCWNSQESHRDPCLALYVFVIYISDVTNVIKSYLYLFHTFISPRLNECKALYVGLSQSSISPLQLVQNTARFLTNASCHEHIPPVLNSLYWLPEIPLAGKLTLMIGR